MNLTFKRILASLAVTVAASTAALAADVAPIVPPAPPPVVVAAPVPVFDWSGPYVGTRAETLFCSGLCWVNLDVHAGYNIVVGRFLVGLEAGAGSYVLSGQGYSLGASARAGLVLGRALAYGKAGILAYGPGTPSYYLTFGGGIEVGVGRSLSVFVGVTAQRSFGGGLYPGIEAGLNFHFGN